jgi:hypothetical protein
VADQQGEVEGAMQTHDGAWPIEVVRRGKTRWYHVIHGDNVIDWLSITSIERSSTRPASTWAPSSRPPEALVGTGLRRRQLPGSRTSIAAPWSS